MTGKQLFEQALALLGLEEEDTVYMQDKAVGCINQMLYERRYEQEALDRVKEQQCFASYKPKKDSQPEPEEHHVPISYWGLYHPLDNLYDEIPYDERFVQECFPYGLAALLIAEDDRSMFNWLFSEYKQHAAYYAPCMETAIRGMDE